MKYCIHCGKGHDFLPKFCSQCGTEWNKPLAAKTSQKSRKVEEDDDDEDEEGSSESVASLLGNLRKAVKVIPLGARVINGKEIATNPDFFAIEDQREATAANYDFKRDMAEVRKMPREEIS
jgi:uncharacterized membrane protein YvbJ